MRIGVLGPIEADVGGPVALTAPKERLLLAALVARRNLVVGVDELIDVLWGESPPRSAAKTLQTYVLHLRRFLGERLVTRAPGYVLDLCEAELDSARFEAMVREGRLSLLRGDPAEASSLLGLALGLWRGRPFEGAEAPLISVEAARLETMRGDAVEIWLEARLLGGGDGDLVADIRAAIDGEPLRERLWALLMRALYRSGRQAEALQAYQRARTMLAEQLGLEPGPELRALEVAVLTQDPALDHDVPVPVPRYATAGDGLRIAYWCRGDGPLDVVMCAEWVFNLEILWDIAPLRPFFQRLSSSARLTVVQRRGTGLSDRSEGHQLDPPEVCVADVDAVLDAIGCRRAVLAGWGHGGQVALAYAAARPDRVARLAVVNGYARLSAAPAYDAGVPREVLDQFMEFMEQVWGTDTPPVPIFGPVAAHDPALRVQVGRINRLIATRREAVTMQRTVNDFDVRHLLDAVQCPVLVVHLAGSVTGAPAARWLAEHLPQATYIELPGAFIPTATEAVDLADALMSFLRPD